MGAGKTIKARQAGDRGGKPPLGTIAAGAIRQPKPPAPRRRVSRHPSPVPPGFSPRGCKGRSPLHKITLVSPFPGGEGGRGDGGKKAAKVRNRPATKTASPPPAREPPPLPSVARVQPRGCKGRSPLHKNNLGLPLPAGKGGRGDGGRKDNKGRTGRRPSWQAPPLGHHIGGGQSGNQNRRAPRRTPTVAKQSGDQNRRAPPSPPKKPK